MERGADLWPNRCRRAAGVNAAVIINATVIGKKKTEKKERE
jgi:hypothetical protein